MKFHVFYAKTFWTAWVALLCTTTINKTQCIGSSTSLDSIGSSYVNRSPFSTLPEKHVSIGPEQPQYSATTSRSLSVLADESALLLTECNSGIFEAGDDIFQSELMDPFFRLVSYPSGAIKAYRPLLFRKLRQAAGLSEEMYTNCLNFSAGNLKCLQSDSKSGQVTEQYF